MGARSHCRLFYGSHPKTGFFDTAHILKPTFLYSSYLKTGFFGTAHTPKSFFLYGSHPKTAILDTTCTPRPAMISVPHLVISQDMLSKHCPNHPHFWTSVYRVLYFCATQRMRDRTRLNSTSEKFEGMPENMYPRSIQMTARNWNGTVNQALAKSTVKHLSWQF